MIDSYAPEAKPKTPFGREVLAGVACAAVVLFAATQAGLRLPTPTSLPDKPASSAKPAYMLAGLDRHHTAADFKPYVDSLAQKCDTTRDAAATTVYETAQQLKEHGVDTGLYDVAAAMDGIVPAGAGWQRCTAEITLLVQGDAVLHRAAEGSEQ